MSKQIIYQVKVQTRDKEPVVVDAESSEDVQRAAHQGADTLANCKQTYIHDNFDRHQFQATTGGPVYRYDKIVKIVEIEEYESDEHGNRTK